MVFKTSTLSNNVKIKLNLRRLTMMLKRVMLMRVVDIALKTATLYTNVKIQVPLRILMWMLRIVMLLVDMVI